MRVANVATGEGPRLAIATDAGWRTVDAAGGLTSMDELVRGGRAAMDRLERSARGGALVEDPVWAAPCVPLSGRVFCIGLNYRRHAAEAGAPLPETPMVFSKFGNALTAAGWPVRLPDTAREYDYEAELGVVMGQRASGVRESDALRFVWGYCSCNDLSARDLQSRTSQFLLGKSLDGFLPVGPHLVSADEVADPQNLSIRSWLNGELRQDSNTSDMVFSVAEVISYISRYIALEAGDFIATGTPEGVIAGRDPKVWMKPGDRIEVEIGELGRLLTVFEE